MLHEAQRQRVCHVIQTAWANLQLNSSSERDSFGTRELECLMIPIQRATVATPISLSFGEEGGVREWRGNCDTVYTCEYTERNTTEEMWKLTKWTCYKFAISFSQCSIGDMRGITQHFRFRFRRIQFEFLWSQQTSCIFPTISQRQRTAEWQSEKEKER